MYVNVSSSFPGKKVPFPIISVPFALRAICHWYLLCLIQTMLEVIIYGTELLTPPTDTSLEHEFFCPHILLSEHLILVPIPKQKFNLYLKIVAS